MIIYIKYSLNSAKKVTVIIEFSKISEYKVNIQK